MYFSKKYISQLIFLVNLLPLSGYAFYGQKITCFWRPTSFTSALKLGGHYRYQEGVTNGIYNYQINPQFYAGAVFNASSYFWHPNFMLFDFGAEYNPIRNQDDYLVVPDQAEVNTIKKLDFRTVFFKQKPISFELFANFNECYTNRENLANLKVNSSNYGGTFNYSNKILPLQVTYQDGKWNEKEIGTGRTFFMHQKNLQADINKSFSRQDRNEFRYSHNNYFRQDDSLAPISNISDNFDLINRIEFDKDQDFTFNSHVSGINQKGYDAYSRIQANELASIKLPANFTLTGGYDFYHNSRLLQKSTQNNVSGSLSYKLYKSLNASVYFEDNALRHTLYQENNYKLGLDVRYIKKIPTGYISLSYASYKQRQKRVSDVVILQVFDESHVLADGTIVLLNKSFIDENSVIVKDVTGTIVYKLNVDYFLIRRNQLLEIQRIPGGQISNNSSVYVDYSYLPPGSYQFNANYRQVAANVVVLNNLIEVYFKLANQDYNNIIAAEMLTLNYFTQTIYGVKLEYKFISGGAEYELYNSSIIPYRLLRYFLVLQGSFKDKFSYSFNGNIRDYYMIHDKTNQQYIDLSGIMSYMIASQTRLNVEFGYRKQVGQEIDLDLLTGKADISTIYRKVNCKIGLQVYRREYLNEKTNFFGGYIEIVRNFNWHKI
jgi:hypothetical protein